MFKQARALRQRKAHEADVFLVEGIHHVGEAVAAGWPLEALLYAPDLLRGDFARTLVEAQSQRGVRCAALAPDLFALLAEKDNPQGILAFARRKAWKFEDLERRGFHLAVALVNPQDPGNVGAILRTIDAVGADGLLLLDGGVDPYHPSSVRASMGAIFWKPVVQASFEECAAWLRRNGGMLIGSSAHASMDYRNFRAGDRPLLLLLGSEQKGLSTAQLAACDAVLTLPMRGRASSLNLAVAAGVLLYAILAEAGEG